MWYSPHHQRRVVARPPSPPKLCDEGGEVGCQTFSFPLFANTRVPIHLLKATFSVPSLSMNGWYIVLSVPVWPLPPPPTWMTSTLSTVLTVYNRTWRRCSLKQKDVRIRLSHPLCVSLFCFFLYLAPNCTRYVRTSLIDPHLVYVQTFPTARAF